MLENRCDCKPLNERLVKETRKQMPDFSVMSDLSDFFKVMDDDITKVELAIKLAQKTRRIVKQNIYFCLFVKLAVLISGALGFSNMWQAVFADVGVSCLAALNAMRAFRIS